MINCVLHDSLIKCATCGSSLEGKPTSRRFCSHSCASKYYWSTHSLTDEERKRREKKYVRNWQDAHREQTREYARRYRNQDLQRAKNIRKKSAKKLRNEIIHHYTNGEMKCQCCGEDNIKFLTIEHIGGWGKEHKNKKWERFSSGSLYAWIRKNDYPDTIGVLCFNCNMGTAKNRGTCPHKDTPPQ